MNATITNYERKNVPNVRRILTRGSVCGQKKSYPTDTERLDNSGIPFAMSVFQQIQMFNKVSGAPNGSFR